jgi:hypothetical protein
MFSNEKRKDSFKSSIRKINKLQNCKTLLSRMNLETKQFIALHCFHFKSNNNNNNNEMKIY